MRSKLFYFLAAMLCCSMSVMAQNNLPDGAVVTIGDSYMTTNFLRAGDVPELVQGTMNYDPTNHVLTLTEVNIVVESSAKNVFGLGLGCGQLPAGSQQIEIRLVGTNFIVCEKSGAYGFALGDGSYVITGLNGTLKVMTNDGTGLALGCEELTIKEGAYVYAGYSESGLQTKTGTGPLLMSNPVVNIDCATFISFGTEYTCAINPGLTKAEELDGYVYNSSLNAWTEDGTTILKNKILEFRPTKHIFMWTNATEEGGTITVTKGGKTLDSPYYFDDSEKEAEVNIVAAPKTGWAFGKWNNFNGELADLSAASTTYKLPVMQAGLLIATFRNTKPAAPSEPWYMLNNLDDKVYKYADLSQDATVVVDNLGGTGMQKVKVTQSVYAEDKLYYLDQVDGSHVCMYSATFNQDAAAAERIKDPQVQVASQDVYQQFYALTYSAKDKCFYAVAKKSDATQYLLKMALDGTAFTEVAPIENSNVNYSTGVFLMAANKEGKLYGVFKSGETFNKENSPYRHGSMLCEIDPATAAVTNIGWTGLYFESPSCGMAFDHITGALIGTNDNGYDKWIFSIDPQTGRATRLVPFTYFNNGLFQMNKVKEGIEQVESGEWKVESGKIIRDGQLFIQRGEEVFNAQGARVK